jgi:hypothetical protein
MAAPAAEEAAGSSSSGSSSSSSSAGQHLIITSELSDFAAQLIGPNVRWFNQDIARAEELANMLLPDRQGTSLRLADHLVVQYSREHVIMIQGEEEGGVPTELWLDYRRILACTGKRFFDVFKRKNAINARLLGVDVKTTVGQIVFLCWYQKRGLHLYMAEHEGDVRNHMQNVEKGGKEAAVVTNAAGNNQTRRNVGNSSSSSSTAPQHVGKKRKSRAPSRSDSVKPVTRMYEGSITMTYT